MNQAASGSGPCNYVALPGSSVFDVSWHGVREHHDGGPFPWERGSVRLRMGFLRRQYGYEPDTERPMTLRAMIDYGRSQLKELRNLGERSAVEVDNIMAKYNLLDEWKVS